MPNLQKSISYIPSFILLRALIGSPSVEVPGFIGIERYIEI